jgi:hypothetical protein
LPGAFYVGERNRFGVDAQFAGHGQRPKVSLPLQAPLPACGAALEHAPADPDRDHDGHHYAEEVDEAIHWFLAVGFNRLLDRTRAQIGVSGPGIPAASAAWPLMQRLTRRQHADELLQPTLARLRLLRVLEPVEVGIAVLAIERLKELLRARTRK